MATLGRTYFWLVGEYKGKKFRIGSFSSEEEANEYGYERLPCSFDIVSSNTKDPNRAIREFKKKQLDETGDLSGAMQRGRRSPPDEYKRGW